jgi:hypothetical protein
MPGEAAVAASAHLTGALFVQNLSDLNPDPLDSLCHHSHPTTVQRVGAVKALLDKKAAKAKAE